MENFNYYSKCDLEKTLCPLSIKNENDRSSNRFSISKSPNKKNKNCEDKKDNLDDSDEFFEDFSLRRSQRDKRSVFDKIGKGITGKTVSKSNTGKTQKLLKIDTSIKNSEISSHVIQDSDILKANNSKISSGPEESNKTNNDVSKQCPLCLKFFEKRNVHMKMCAKKKNISTVQLIEALELQEKQIAERQALGLPSGYQPRRTTTINKKGPTDSNLELAMALSVSMQEQRETITLQEAEILQEAGLEEEANIKRSTLEGFGFFSSKPLKKDCGKTKSTVTPILLTRTKEDRERILTEKVAMILLEETVSTPFPEKRPKVHSKKLLRFIDETQKLWKKSATYRETQDYYVITLCNYVSPSKADISSGLRHLSQIPGRINTPEKDQDGNDFPEISDSFPTPRIDMEVTQPTTLKTPIADCVANKSTVKKISRTKSVTQNITTTLSKNWHSVINNKFMSDITIICKNEIEIPAHKLVLHVRCPAILTDVVKNDNAAGGKEIIFWSNTTKEVCLILLEFIYCGIVTKIKSLDQKQLEELKVLADKLNLIEIIHFIRTDNCSVKNNVKRDLFSTNKSVLEETLIFEGKTSNDNSITLGECNNYITTFPPDHKSPMILGNETVSSPSNENLDLLLMLMDKSSTLSNELYKDNDLNLNPQSEGASKKSTNSICNELDLVNETSVANICLESSNHDSQTITLTRKRKSSQDIVSFENHLYSKKVCLENIRVNSEQIFDLTEHYNTTSNNSETLDHFSGKNSPDFFDLTQSSENSNDNILENSFSGQDVINNLHHTQNITRVIDLTQNIEHISDTRVSISTNQKLSALHLTESHENCIDKQKLNSFENNESDVYVNLIQSNENSDDRMLKNSPLGQDVINTSDHSQNETGTIDLTQNIADTSYARVSTSASQKLSTLDSMENYQNYSDSKINSFPENNKLDDCVNLTKNSKKYVCEADSVYFNSQLNESKITLNQSPKNQDEECSVFIDPVWDGFEEVDYEFNAHLNNSIQNSYAEDSRDCGLGIKTPFNKNNSMEHLNIISPVSSSYDLTTNKESYSDSTDNQDINELKTLSPEHIIITDTESDSSVKSHHTLDCEKQNSSKNKTDYFRKFLDDSLEVSDSVFQELHEDKQVHEKPNKIISKPHCVTPVCKTPSTSNVTPLPDYSAMKTVKFNKQLKKYGLKTALGRRKGKLMLRYIYDQLHPLVPETKEKINHLNENIDDDEKKIVNESSSSESDTESKSSDSSSCAILEESILPTDFIVESDINEALSQQKLQKITSLDVPTKVKELINNDSELHEKILLYQPIFIEDILERLKTRGYKCKMTDLMDYLDDQCITFRSLQGIKNRLKTQQKREARRKKKELL
uniref:Structure-specific endonuclease subunit SLX4 n=1 Tax=Clastoptera arizonana TaxID=38151 RepID=A0A1B6D098_9HEMI